MSMLYNIGIARLLQEEVYIYIYGLGFPMITKVVPQTRQQLYRQ